MDLVTGRPVTGPALRPVDPPRLDAAQSAALARVVRAAARRAGAGFRSVVVPRMSSADADGFARALADAVSSIGYLVLHASAARRPSIVRGVVCRHVVVFCAADADREPAQQWVRELGMASTRPHVLVAPAPDGVSARAWLDGDCVGERAPLWRPDEPVAVAQWRRAGHAARRGRHAAAARWLRAAFEAARRRRDERAMAAAAKALSGHLACRGRWEAASVVCRDALRTLDRADARAQLAARAASLAIHLLRVDEAEAALGCVEAERTAVGLALDDVTRLRRVEVLFWQGRTEEAVATLERLPETRDERGFWRALLARLAGADVAPPVVGTEGVEARSRGAALRIAGGEAPAWPTRASPLEHLVRDRFEAGDTHPVKVRRICLPGSWSPVGLSRGRSGMQLIHELPGLVQRVAEAQDDHMALASACAWLRGQPGVLGVAVLSSDGRTVAADGYRRSDLSAAGLRDALTSERRRVVFDGGVVMAAAPVRYAGSRIGAVIGRAEAELAETLQQGCLLVAALCGPALRCRVDAMAAQDGRVATIPAIVGDSPAIDAVRRAVVRAAATGFAVLVEGESGTGKELVARALHELSPRRARRFCAVNCAALTDELVEAELFGFARGAFTGAVAARAGLFEEAHGGTLFLDEIGELTARAQAKLLRAIQDGEIRRLGENACRRVDVRIVAATNRRLAHEAGAGTFREDLLFRLAVARIEVPPLRERVEDIPLLARTFWARTAGETGTRARLGPDAVAALCRHDWPGNVRELQNAIAALVLVAPDRGRVGSRHVTAVLSASSSGQEPPVPLDVGRRLWERRRIAAALARHGGRRAPAARELGLTRQGLAKAMRRVGLTPGDRHAGVA